MGRNTTTPDPQQLSRFSVGEIQDFSGVPAFYNAGTSKWLRSATATSSSNLSATTKTNLANAGTAAAQTVLVQSALSSSYISAGYIATMPIQRISASGISVVPSSFTQSTAVGVGVITSAGIQTVATGQVSGNSNNSSGSNVAVASNDTTIFAYTPTNANTFLVSSTTNGTTWTAQTVTGLPTTYDSLGSSFSYGTTSGIEAKTSGWYRTAAGLFQFAAFWCGARFLLIGVDTTNFVATLSTNGYDFGGDNTTAVIDGAVARTSSIQFYRNGNNCYLNVGTRFRYSTDGGITWATCTFAAAPNPGNYYMQYNQSDPAKLVIRGSGGTNTTAYYTSNSGQTWSASRTLPLANCNGGLYYKGSTLVVSNASNATSVSTDDGVTWTSSIFPIGVLSANTKVFADANRWYLGINGQAQLLTSSDGVTWTIRTLPQQFAISSSNLDFGFGIVPFDSNTVSLIGYNNISSSNQCLFTLDGGVTWTGSQFTVSNETGIGGVGNAFVTPDAGGVGFTTATNSNNTAINANVMKGDLVSGGAFYRTGTTAITPARTNAIAFVRVE